MKSIIGNNTYTLRKISLCFYNLNLQRSSFCNYNETNPFCVIRNLNMYEKKKMQKFYNKNFCQKNKFDKQNYANPQGKENSDKKDERDGIKTQNVDNQNRNFDNKNENKDSSKSQSDFNDNKTDFYKKYSNFKEFAFKNENSQTQDDQNSENNPQDNSNKDSSNFSEFDNKKYGKKKARSSYVENKQIDLIKIYKPDLFYFKLQEDFDVNELRKKYLELAKLYHPDLRTNDEFSNFQFNKLKDSYERLKRFAELRDELVKMQNEGSVTFTLNEYEQENLIKKRYDEKDEYIKNLCKKVKILKLM